MLIRNLKLNNLLSFGPDEEAIPLRNLNVLIGPNGSGKSNVLESIALLKSAPRALAEPIREGGGIHDWLWKGSPKTPTACLETIMEIPVSRLPLRYRIEFTERGRRFHLVNERVETERPYDGHSKPYLYYGYEDSRPFINVRATSGEPQEGTNRELRREDVDPEQSILSQRKDPDQYPELTRLGEELSKIRLYREWSFGRYTAPRLPQRADMPNDFLEEDARNLGVMINRLCDDPSAKQEFLSGLRALYDGVTDFNVRIEGTTVQVFLHEGRIAIPATRLSDGTLRYLCLLVILCHPLPPPLVCIEEPELGLHPDIMPNLAAMLRSASERMQLVVTTHSTILVDALTDDPESVIVCEKRKGSTSLQRLERDSLKEWLRDYSLGELWRRGEIGGNRW